MGNKEYPLVLFLTVLVKRDMPFLNLVQIMIREALQSAIENLLGF
jgi:hypothetical protein